MPTDAERRIRSLSVCLLDVGPRGGRTYYGKSSERGSLVSETLGVVREEFANDELTAANQRHCGVVSGHRTDVDDVVDGGTAEITFAFRSCLGCRPCPLSTDGYLLTGLNGAWHR